MRDALATIDNLNHEVSKGSEELRQVRATLDREVSRSKADLRQAIRYIGQLQHENQRSKDYIDGLQNELNNVRQQLEDAKTLSVVRGKELFGAQVDTLSISEVSEKVTALNDENFLAAATLGKAFIHKSHETNLDAAAAESQEMVGEKLTNILIAQSQKLEAEVNPLLVQTVLEIIMVKFCVSKIQSSYPGDSRFSYSEISSTGKHCIDSKSSSS